MFYDAISLIRIQNLYFNLYNSFFRNVELLSINKIKYKIAFDKISLEKRKMFFEIQNSQNLLTHI